MGPYLLRGEALRQIGWVEDSVQPPAAAAATGPAAVQPHDGYFHLHRLRELDYAQASFHLQSWQIGLVPNGLCCSGAPSGRARRVQV